MAELVRKQLHAEVKQVDASSHLVEVIVSTPTPDREGEVVLPSAWELDNYKKNPVLVNAHQYGDVSNILGKALDIWADTEGLHAKFEYFVGQGNPVADWAWALVRAGLGAYSVGFIELQSKPGEGAVKKIYTKVELLEVSQVVVPANPQATVGRNFDMERLALAQKYLQEEGGESMKQKAVIPFRDYGIVEDRTAEWDAGAEVREAEVEDLRKMCAWYDEENPDIKGSYKLPHHRVSDYKAVWRGVVAAMAALNGARGGVNIPESDYEGVYNHIARHYEQWGEEAPELRRDIGDDLAILKHCGADIETEEDAKAWLDLVDVVRTGFVEVQEVEPKTKAGRVLSRANAERIKGAITRIDELKAEIRRLMRSLDGVQSDLEDLLESAGFEEVSMEDTKKAVKIQEVLRKLLEIL